MNERTTLVTELNVFANFQPTLPPSYTDSPFIFLGNIDPTLQHSVLKQVKRKPKVVGLDTMNYWIERTPAELKETLKHIQVLVINDDETRQLTGQHNLTRAAKEIFKMGPKTLVIKRGEHGAMMMHEKFLFSVPAFPLEEVHDPTGAGDSFAGGFMGYLAGAGKVNERTLRNAMVYGSVLGSFAVEKFGVQRLTNLNRSEIHARARLSRSSHLSSCSTASSYAVAMTSVASGAKAPFLAGFTAGLFDPAAGRISDAMKRRPSRWPI